jgi:hypothetical protein
MNKYYIGDNKNLFDFLNINNNFKQYNCSKYNKNNILSIINFLSTLSKNDIVISDGLYAYFLYFASDYFNIHPILINPIFFKKNGNLITPSMKVIKRSNPNKKMFISLKNPNLKNFKKFFENEIIETDNVIEQVIEHIDKITEHIKKSKYSIKGIDIEDFLSTMNYTQTKD